VRNDALCRALSAESVRPNMLELETERLKLVALDRENLQFALTHPRKVEENLGLVVSNQALEGPVRKAAEQMLQQVTIDERNYLWHTLWRIVLKAENRIIGGFDFKGGPDAAGQVEIGYGIQLEYRGRGYMLEALSAAAARALGHAKVSAVLAETERSNTRSHRVLEKAGFLRYRETGEMLWWRLSR